MHLKDLISNNAEMLNSKAVFSGTSVTIQTLFDNIEAGNTIEEFLEDFPGVTKPQVMAALTITQNKLEM